MRKQEIEFIPLTEQGTQHFPTTIRGFLLKWLCVLLGHLNAKCSCEKPSRGGKVEETIIEY
jgi:hypothetical protein